MESGDEVQPEVLLEPLGAHGVDARQEGRCPRVVDPDVESPELGLGPFDQAFDGGGVEQVGREGDGSPSRAPDVRGGPLQVLGAPGRHGHVRARAGQGQGDLAADALAAAGDHGDLPLEAHIHLRSISGP